jgi:hypothetical protein
VEGGKKKEGGKKNNTRSIVECLLQKEKRRERE